MCRSRHDFEVIKRLFTVGLIFRRAASGGSVAGAASFDLPAPLAFLHEGVAMGHSSSNGSTTASTTSAAGSIVITA